MLEMALGVCKLSLRIQTITLIFHSSKGVMKPNPDPQASVEEGMSALPTWLGSITTSNTRHLLKFLVQPLQIQLAGLARIV